jgi:carboxylesterase type B
MRMAKMRWRGPARLLPLVLLACCFVGLCLASGFADESVETVYGTVKGFKDGETIKYLGQPFAKPPVNALRFEAAQEPDPWNGTLEATDYGPGCPQPACDASSITCPTTQDEDCLYLNVYRPVGEAPEEGWPVFVWIHGGAFIGGSGSNQVYPGLVFTENGFILVTINYRLGALGWLNYGDIEGNFGLSDQRMALRWVQDNIGAFGGDKDAVTVGGESAGAMAILVHLASPASKGLFSKAIVESGTIALPYNKPTGPNSLNKNTFYKELMEFAGCPQTEGDFDYGECLRSLSVQQILDATSDTVTNRKTGKTRLTDLAPFLKQPADMVEPFYPVINTKDVPLSPLDAFTKGKFNKVPLLIGNNADEGDLFVGLLFGENATVNKAFELPTILSLAFGLENSLKIRKLYPVFGEHTGKETLANITTDYFFTGSTNKVASLFAKHDVPVYTYIFDYVPKEQMPGSSVQAGPLGGSSHSDRRTICKDKVCHGAEIPYVFDDLQVLSNSEEDETVAKSVSSYWRDFIKPNASTKEDEDEDDDTTTYFNSVWPPYTKDAEKWLRIGNTMEIVDNIQPKEMQLWNEIGFDLWPNKV